MLPKICTFSADFSPLVGTYVYTFYNLHFIIYSRGIDVLNTKSELERAMEKRNRNRKEQEKIHEQQASKTPFQKMLEDRAKRLEKIVSNFNIIFGLRKKRERGEIEFSRQN